MRQCRNGGISERYRLKRIVSIAMFALAILALFVPAAVSAAKPSSIVAVGDLHGDYQAWLTIARAAGLIDAAGHWAGGRTTLVQLGDITRPRAGLAEIVRNLQQLQTEAPRAGGKVVVVLGNHEAMNLLGDFRYTTPGEFAAFAATSSPARREHIYEPNRTQRSKQPPMRRTRADAAADPRRMDGRSIRSAGSSTSSPGARRASLANGRPATRRS